MSLFGWSASNWRRIGTTMKVYMFLFDNLYSRPFFGLKNEFDKKNPLIWSSIAKNNSQPNKSIHMHDQKNKNESLYHN